MQLMQLSFGNMMTEFNVFNVNKQLQDNEDVADVDMIETLDDDSFVSTNCDNALNMCLTRFGSYFDVDSAIDKVNVLLESAPVMDTIKWKQKIYRLPTSEEKNIPLVQPPPKIELKELHDTLQYAFLGETNTLPVDEKVEIFVVEFEQDAALKSYFHEEHKFKFLRINDKWCKITRCKQNRSSNALFKVP
ncbi:reverse transcriptase [Abeliophyllum distichum]|uniref:Reverse transcriptase n=1 Tax=Abeliophyllum distichum TaxID=126358 RepID=A0ABD1NXV8_9LAMI